MWVTGKHGCTVEILSESGEVIATVGEAKDFRVDRKLTHAALLAAAPDMLDLLIDMQEFFKRGYICEHPLAENINKKLKEVIDRSFYEIRRPKVRDVPRGCADAGGHTGATEDPGGDRGPGPADGLPPFFLEDAADEDGVRPTD